MTWDAFVNLPILWYVVCEEEKPVGVVSVGHLDHINRHAGFGIIVAPSERQRGVAAACDPLVKQLAFKQLNLHRAWASVVADNKVVVEGLKKLGWKHQGTMRDAQFIDGSWRDRMYFEFYNPDEVR